MLHPEEIRLSILSKPIPAHWHIIRGSASLAIRNVWVRGMIPPFLGFLLGSAASAWIRPSGSFNLSFMVVYTSIILLTGTVFSFVAASIARRSVIAFLPEGCLQFSDINSNLPYTQKMLWYALIDDIQLNSNFLIGTYLVIRDHEGKTQKWYPSPSYGRCARAVQEVLTAYITYKALNVSQLGRENPILA